MWRLTIERRLNVFIEMAAQHDRAPLFVRTADGSIRNGYTIKLVNKTGRDAVFELSVGGVAGARMAIAEASHNAVLLHTIRGAGYAIQEA